MLVIIKYRLCVLSVYSKSHIFLKSHEKTLMNKILLTHLREREYVYYLKHHTKSRIFVIFKKCTIRRNEAKTAPQTLTSTCTHTRVHTHTDSRSSKRSKNKLSLVLQLCSQEIIFDVCESENNETDSHKGGQRHRVSRVEFH